MLSKRIRQLAVLRPGEGAPAALAALLFFCILCSYYILRPLREEMGLAGGVRNLPYLYLATLATMLVATPLFGALVKRFQRQVFLVATYRLFMTILVLFWLALQFLPERLDLYLGRVFYVWISVFNLFAVSLFWAFMADGFGYERSKRLFGLIAVGGTLGAVVGSGLTAGLSSVIGRSPLLLVSVFFLAAAIQCLKLLDRHFLAPDWTTPAQDSGASAPLEEERQTSGALGGIALTLRSPYLLAITAYLFLYSFSSTIVYFEQANIVADHVSERVARAALFARIDLWVNAVTLVTQLLWTGRILRRLGVAVTLTVLPLVTAAGFFALGVAPILPVLIVFQVLRRASNYALVKPARETLYTILSREAKYKAKSFIDTFVYRGGDAIGALLFKLVTRLGLSLGGVAFAAVPLAVIWAGVGLYLGRRQTALATAGNGDPAAPSHLPADGSGR